MSAFETATKFFHACESLEGWEGCKGYVGDGATFTAQCEPLVDIDTVEAYCEWMAGLGNGPLKGCVYEINGSSYDEANKMAIFYATITGTHVGDGGPVPPTNKQTVTDLRADDERRGQGREDVQGLERILDPEGTRLDVARRTGARPAKNGG
jgi:hypothetical protein